MARECFCGCGRKLGFNDRSISKKGAAIEGAELLEEYTLAALRTQQQPTTDLEDFIQDGRDLRDQLVAVLHHEADPRTVDRRHIDWHKRAAAILEHLQGRRLPRSQGRSAGSVRIATVIVLVAGTS